MIAALLAESSLGGKGEEQRERRQTSSPTIATADGSVSFTVAEGQHVSVQIGDEEPFFIDELPEEVKTYSDAAIKQFALGFQVARANADNGVPSMLDYINNDLEDRFAKNVAEANAAKTAAEDKCDSLLQEIDARVEKIEAFSFTTSTTATTTTITTTTTTIPDNGLKKSSAGITCATILDNHPKSEDGTYWITPYTGDVEDAFEAYCDMDEGGWTYAEKGKKFRIAYSGKTVQLTTAAVKDTTYWFDAFGAAAGKGYQGQRQSGGRGGFVTGSKKFAAKTKLFINIGGMGGMGHREDQDGSQSTYNYAGWNGGGRGTRGGSGGGGCTDVRLQDGVLQSRIIVGAGGGGCGSGQCDKRGGHGGGMVGEQASDGQASGGTQSGGGRNNCNCQNAFGKFGKGGDYCDQNDSGGGGCGWYGGSASCSSNRPGAGGSSFYGKMDARKATQQGGGSEGHGYLEYIFK